MRFCILLCYLYHGLNDSECRACLCFCLFLLRNSLCNELLTLIDWNGRKTVLDTERSNGKDQVKEEISGAEAGFEEQDKARCKPGQGEHPKWNLAAACRLMLPCLNFQTRHNHLGKEAPPNPAVGREDFWVKGLRDSSLILKGGTQNRSNVPSFHSYSSFLILKSKWTFSTQAEHPQGKKLTDSACNVYILTIQLKRHLFPVS